MNPEMPAFLTFSAMFVVAAALMGLVIGRSHGETAVRTAAISAGVAEYVVTDKQTGAVEFRFIPPAAAIRGEGEK